MPSPVQEWQRFRPFDLSWCVARSLQANFALVLRCLAWFADGLLADRDPSALLAAEPGIRVEAKCFLLADAKLLFDLAHGFAHLSPLLRMAIE